MGAADDTSKLLRAVARLAGPAVRQARHAHFFRITVTSSDGLRCGVPIMVSSHRRKGPVTQAVLNNIADCLLIGHEDIVHVLDTYTAEQLRAHLERHTAEELKPRRLRDA